MSTIKTLKHWNKVYPNILYDSKYLKRLAVDVFGLECLAKSSVLGRSANNTTAQHAPLDAVKLGFMRGDLI